jgi:O-antigen/teichoic acid export membrane protein
VADEPTPHAPTQPGPAEPRADVDAQRTIRVARNAVSNYVRFFGNGVVSFLLTPLMVHLLGDRDYGLWITVFSVTGYFGLVDQGLRPSLVRYVSRERAAGDVEGLSSTLSSALLLYTVAGVLVAAGAIGLAFGFGTWFHLDPQQIPVARATLILAGVSLALGFPFGVFAAALSGLQRYDIANAMGLVVLVVRALAFVVVLRMGGGLVALAWVALATNLLGYFMTMIAVRRMIPDARFAWRYVNRPHLKRIASYSGYAFIGALASSLAFKTDAVVITAFLGTALVTPFAIASGLVDNARTLVYSATWVLSPTASELDTLGERAKLQAMMVNGAKVSVLICWPVLFALMVFGDSLLATWVGPSYRSAATLIVVLALPTLVALPQSAASSVLFGVSRHRGVVLLALLNALLNLGLSILWVRPLGLTGVALGTAVPLVIVGGIATGVYAARALDLPLKRYFWEGMARPGIVSLSFLVPALVLRAFWRPMGWGPLLVAVAVRWVVFAAAAWRWAFNAGERARWSHAAPRVFGFAPAASAAGGARR